MDDLINRQTFMKAMYHRAFETDGDTMWQSGCWVRYRAVEQVAKGQPSVDAVEVVRCKDCKHWRRQTNYAGALLSFGFCESDDMWRSLYGETYEVSHIDTDDVFYCGYAERREDD